MISTRDGQFERNLRFLLWRASYSRKDWVELLASWAACAPDRARSLLRGEPPTAGEVTRIGESVLVDEESLLQADLLTEHGTAVLPENVRYLSAALPHGGIKALAEALGIDRATVPAWAAGRQRPSLAHQQALKRYFGVSLDTDIEVEPLFLSLEPIGDRERRDWVRERINSLNRQDFAELFPALRRMLSVPCD